MEPRAHRLVRRLRTSHGAYPRRRAACAEDKRWSHVRARHRAQCRLCCRRSLYGWVTGSLALLADAAHNLSDVGGLLLAWAAFAAARLKPDERHTYGWRRGSILASFANAIILLVAMGSLAWEAVQRFREPIAVAGGTVIAVAAIGVVDQRGDRLAVLPRQQIRPEHPRRLPAHGGRCTGVRRRGHRRPALPLAGLDLDRPGR